MDEYFPDAPRIMPSKQATGKAVSVEVVPGDDFKFNPEDHQKAFSTMLKHVKAQRGDKFQKEATATLVESLVKAAALESYYFDQLSQYPQATEIFRSWNATVATKIALTKKLGL